MIRPLDALVFSLHHAHGVYALLLGSGVSRGASIPTGWEIIQDLIRKVAHVRNEKIDGEPTEWYRAQNGEEPNYSKLLEELASTKAERQALLKGYFEPDEEERERGDKLPTDAHKAVARLVRRGVIRVILTTNFDRLLEMALEEEGISPTVVSTPSAMKGAPPLAHSSCLVVKLHGDYLDTRIRNTEEELSRYPQAQQRLLRQVFDEYGVIVCGWSGEWDQALYDSLANCRNQRYTTFWAVHQGQLSGEAERLIQLRHARVIPIEGANSFLTAVAENLAALEDVDRPHPLSKEIAVAQLKRYLPEERHRIRLSDLLVGEVERVYEQLSVKRFPIRSVKLDPQHLEERLRRYEAVTVTLEHLMATGAFFGTKEHESLWVKALERIGNAVEADTIGGAWWRLQWYPATRLFYAAGIAALAANNFSLLWALLSVPMIRRRHQEAIPLCTMTNPWCIDGRLLNDLLGKRDLVPGSEFLFEDLSGSLEPLIPARLDYERLFDRFELLVAIGVASLEEQPYVGRFHFQATRSVGPIPEMIAELDEHHENWPPLKQGFCGGSLEGVKSALRVVESRSPR